MKNLRLVLALLFFTFCLGSKVFANTCHSILIGATKDLAVEPAKDPETQTPLEEIAHKILNLKYDDSRLDTAARLEQLSRVMASNFLEEESILDRHIQDKNAMNHLLFDLKPLEPTNTISFEAFNKESGLSLAELIRRSNESIKITYRANQHIIDLLLSYNQQVMDLYGGVQAISNLEHATFEHLDTLNFLDESLTDALTLQENFSELLIYKADRNERLHDFLML